MWGYAIICHGTRFNQSFYRDVFGLGYHGIWDIVGCIQKPFDFASETGGCTKILVFEGKMMIVIELSSNRL